MTTRQPPELRDGLEAGTAAVEVRPRKFPYPFQAMLAVCSDTDRTTIERFRNIHRFLNTEAETPLGRGVGLDVADSVWVFTENVRDMSLLSAYDRSSPTYYADELTAYAHCGWIDSLHTYGNYSVVTPESPFVRRHAVLALEELTERNLALRVWVNHGSEKNIQNIGRWGEGDSLTSGAYHTDLLLEYGVCFAWNHQGGTHAGVSNPLAPLQLRDDRSLWGFVRYSSVTGAAVHRMLETHDRSQIEERRIAIRNLVDAPAAMTWWPEFIDTQLEPECLDQLVARSEFCIAAQHLGDLKDSDDLPTTAVETFRLLREYQDQGLIQVARTSRLLEYARVSQHLQFETHGSDRQLYVDITSVADPVMGTFVPTLDQLRGVTFYVTDPANTHLLLNGEAIRGAELLRAPSDGTAPSIGVRWFKPDTTDYTAEFEARSA